MVRQGDKVKVCNVKVIPNKECMPKHKLLVMDMWFNTTKNLALCGTDGRLLLSGFQLLVTLTLILDRVIWHTVVHHSPTSIYIPNFIEI